MYIYIYMYIYTHTYMGHIRRREGPAPHGDGPEAGAACRSNMLYRYIGINVCMYACMHVCMYLAAPFPPFEANLR